MTMNYKSNNVNELITMARRVSEQKRAEAGIVMPALNPANVPHAIRPLLQHAEILGIGDDRTRGKIFDLVSSEYIDSVKQDIAACPELGDWYLQSEATRSKHLPEVAAIGWMLIGLNVNF
jgi:hypothetical protein